MEEVFGELCRMVPSFDPDNDPADEKSHRLYRHRRNARDACWRRMDHPLGIAWPRQSVRSRLLIGATLRRAAQSEAAVAKSLLPFFALRRYLPHPFAWSIVVLAFW
jgi:hypothetical protein